MAASVVVKTDYSTIVISEYVSILGVEPSTGTTNIYFFSLLYAIKAGKVFPSRIFIRCFLKR